MALQSPAPPAPSRPRRFVALLPEERRTFAACLIALLAIRGVRAFDPSYSIDDYILLHDSSTPVVLVHHIAEGRFGAAGLHAILVQLGFDPVTSYAAGALVAIALLAFAAVWLVRAWRLPARDTATALTAALLFAHPYLADVFTFRIAPVNFAAACALALSGFALVRERGAGMVPIVLVAASLSLYQVALPLLVVASIVAILLDALDTRGSARELRGVLRGARSTLGSIAIGTMLYAIANVAVQRALGIAPASRTAVLGWEDVPRRLHEALGIYAWILSGDAVYGTALLAALVLALLAGATAVFAVRAVRLRAPGLAALGLVGPAAAIAAVPGVVLVVDELWPAGRTLTAMGLVVGGLLAVCTRTRLRRVALAIGALLLLGWAGRNGRIADEQQRINASDREMAREIAARLRTEPGFADMATLVLVNAPHSNPLRAAVHLDLNVSALRVPWAGPFVVQELIGRRLRMPSADEAAAARKHCARAPRWPEPGAVRVLGVVGVGCFAGEND